MNILTKIATQQDVHETWNIMLLGLPFTIEAIINALLLFVTIASVACAFAAYKHQRNRAKKEVACKLARFYAEKIINRYDYIIRIFIRAGLSEEIKAWFPMKNIFSFNEIEMRELIEKANVKCEEVEEKMENIAPDVIFKTRMDCCDTYDERHAMLKTYAVGYDIADLNRDNAIEVQGALVQRHFIKEVMNYLNDMEWFAMNCMSGVADDELLFQSIHQTYLSSIWFLYYYICRNNAGAPEDKYFTNVIFLFRKWKNKVDKLRKENEEKNRKAMKKEAKANKKKLKAEREVEKARKEMREDRVVSGKKL